MDSTPPKRLYKSGLETRINVRLREEVLAAIRVEALSQGIRLSDYLRQIITTRPAITSSQE